MPTPPPAADPAAPAPAAGGSSGPPAAKVPESYICNNINYPLYHAYVSGMWTYPNSVSDNTVVCMPQDKPCTGQYELTTYYPLYPQSAPNNPAANSGSLGGPMQSYVDLRCVDSPTPEEDRFQILDEYFPCYNGVYNELTGATTKSVCESVMSNTMLPAWVNSDTSSSLANFSLYQPLNSSSPILKCSIETDPKESAQEMNQCVSGSTGDTYYKVSCNGIPYDADFKLMGTSLSSDATQPQAAGVQRPTFQQYGGVKNGQASPEALLQNWYCDKAVSPFMAGKNQDRGSVYNCSGYVQGVNGKPPQMTFVLMASENVSCNNPSFANCVSCLYNNFQKTLVFKPEEKAAGANTVAVACSCPEEFPWQVSTGGGTDRCVSSYSGCPEPSPLGSQFDDPSIAMCTYVCMDMSGAQATQMKDKDGNIVSTKEECEAMQGSYQNILPNLADFGDKHCPTCAEGPFQGKPCVSGQCRKEDTSAGAQQNTPLPQMGLTDVKSMPDFKPSPDEENVWVPSQWPTLASPLPQMLEFCSGVPGLKCPNGQPGYEQDMMNMVQSICSITQLNGNGSMMKYVTVYEPEETEAINHILFSNLHTGCKQVCDMSSKTCSVDTSIPCSHDSDCPSRLSTVFVPKYSDGSCLKPPSSPDLDLPCLSDFGVCDDGPTVGKPCTKDSDCLGQIGDVRQSSVPDVNKCTNDGGQWSWYARPPNQAEMPYNPEQQSTWYTVYEGDRIDPSKFIQILPQEKATWDGTSDQAKAWDGNNLQWEPPSVKNMCKMYVLTQQGQAPPDGDTNACVSAGKVLDGVIKTPPVNTQNAACPPFCSGGYSHDDPGDDNPGPPPSVPISEVCSGSRCVTNRTIQWEPGANSQVSMATGCAAQGGSFQPVTWQKGGTYTGSVQCYPENHIWNCEPPIETANKVDGQNTTDNATKVIECSPVMLGTNYNFSQDFWQDPPNTLQMAGTATQTAASAPYINTTIEMHANLVNAKLKAFQHFNKSTPDSYNLRDFNRDYMLWKYG